MGNFPHILALKNKYLMDSYYKCRYKNFHINPDNKNLKNIQIGLRSMSQSYFGLTYLCSTLLFVI